MYAHRRQKRREGAVPTTRYPSSFGPNSSQSSPVRDHPSQHKVSQSGGTGIPRFHSSFSPNRVLILPLKGTAQQHNISSEQASKHMLKIILGGILHRRRPCPPNESNRTESNATWVPINWCHRHRHGFLGPFVRASWSVCVV